MSGSPAQILAQALTRSKMLPIFVERIFEDWQGREGSRHFFKLLTDAAIRNGIVDRRGNPPNKRSVARAWTNYKYEREKRRQRAAEIAAEKAAWQTALSIVPSRAVSQVTTGPPHYHEYGLDDPDASEPSVSDEDDDDDERIRRMILKQSGL